VQTNLSGSGRSVTISSDGPFTVIGERINPSGRRRLAQALSRSEMSLVRSYAMAQLEAGAHLIDVNVSVSAVDEQTVLPLAIQTVAEVTDVPLCIDTPNERALRAALEVCPGKPLVNSVTGERASLNSVLPLVEEYGCAVIGLTIDDQGIPWDARRRYEIAERILDAAKACGVPAEDVVIDPLAMVVGVDQQAALVTLEAIELIRSRLGVNITVGASNISFGLPERSLINRSFLTMGMAAGLNCAILDPLDVEMRRAIAAADLLLGKDDFAVGFVGRSRHGW